MGTLSQWRGTEMHLFQSPHKPPSLTLSVQGLLQSCTGALLSNTGSPSFLDCCHGRFAGIFQEKKQKKGMLPTQLCYCHLTQTVKLGKLAAHVYLNIAKAFTTQNLCVAYLSFIILQTLFSELLYIQLFRLACYVRVCYLSPGINTF